jgi:hypothetical protein
VRRLAAQRRQVPHLRDTRRALAPMSQAARRSTWEMGQPLPAAGRWDWDLGSSDWFAPPRSVEVALECVPEWKRGGVDLGARRTRETPRRFARGRHAAGRGLTGGAGAARACRTWGRGREVKGNSVGRSVSCAATAQALQGGAREMET